MKTVFEFRRPSGVTLSEYYSDGKYFFKLNSGASSRELSLYSIIPEPRAERSIYLGHTLDEVLDSGRDILGEALLSGGDPVYSEVKKALPEITENAFAFLGGPASWAGLTVLTDGNIVHQASGRDRTPKPIFVPAEYDSELGSITPRQSLVGGTIPVSAIACISR